MRSRQSKFVQEQFGFKTILAIGNSEEFDKVSAQCGKHLPYLLSKLVV